MTLLFLESLFFLCWFCDAAELVTYKFGYKFGQIFHDYSLNYQSSVNGMSSAVDSADTVPSDRGAYFYGPTTQVTLPVNDQVSTAFALPGAFTIIAIMMTKAPGSIVFTRYLSASNYIYMRIDNTNNLFIARVMQDNQDSGEQSYPCPNGNI